jgi:hypothetical protein
VAAGVEGLEGIGGMRIGIGVDGDASGLAISSAWAKFSNRGTSFSSGGRSLRDVMVRLISPTSSKPSIDL